MAKSKKAPKPRKARVARDPFKKMLSRAYASARSSSRTKGRHYHRVLLTADQIKAQWERQEGRCYWLGIKLDLQDVWATRCLIAPSVDRVNNDWGYFPSNIVISSRFANLGRVGTTTTEFIPQIRAIRKRIYGDMWPKFLFDGLPAQPPVAAKIPKVIAEQFELPLPTP